MSQQSVPVSRTLVGLIALACLGTAAGLAVWGAENELWVGAFTRVGLVMAAFWLALPARGRDAAWANVSPWTFVGVLLAVFAVARFKWAVLPILAVIAVIGFLLHPRSHKRPPRPAPPSPAERETTRK